MNNQELRAIVVKELDLDGLPDGLPDGAQDQTPNLIQ